MTETKSDTTIDLLRKVAEDAQNLISCNCSYERDTPPEARCDGSCTHGMATRALQQLQAGSWYLVTARLAFDDEDTCFTVQASDKADAMAQVTAQLRERAAEDDNERDVEDYVYIIYVVRCGASEPVIEKGAQQ